MIKSKRDSKIEKSQQQLYLLRPIYCASSFPAFEPLFDSIFLTPYININIYISLHKLSFTLTLYARGAELRDRKLRRQTCGNFLTFRR